MIQGSRRYRRPLAAVTLLTLSVIATSAATSAAAVSGTVAALWHMDEQPGASVMVDSSGFNHNGAIGTVSLGVPSYDASTAYEFTGKGLVRVPNAADLNPGSQPLTISAHVLVPANLANGDYNLIEKGVATTTGGAYKMEIFGKSKSRRFGYPDCAFNGANGHNRVYGPFTIADGKWHQVVCNLTATQAFVTVDDTPGPKATRAVDTIANTTDLTIGGKPNNTHYYIGRADEISITIG